MNTDYELQLYQDIKQQLIDEGYIKKNRKKGAKIKISDEVREIFDIFYSYYPRKTGRQEALKKWVILNPNRELKKKMYDHYTVAYKNTEKSFIPHFSTYLNQARWNDEIIKVKPKLLAVPKADDTAAIDKFVTKHDLPKATTEKDYWEYRGVLVKYIEDKQLMASSA